MAFTDRLDPGSDAVISLRYHLVSLIAVFLALAAGIAVGTTQLKGAVVSDLRGQVKHLAAQRSALQASGRSQAAQLSAGSGFAAAIEPDVIAGALHGSTVVLITTAGTDPSVVADLRRTLGDAGARVTGPVALAAGYTDPQRAAALNDFVTSSLPAGLTLPASSDTGTLAGTLLADMLVAHPVRTAPSAQIRAQVMAGFRSLGVVDSAAAPAAVADYAVLVDTAAQTGSNPSEQAKTLGELSSALAARGAGAVVAGTAAAAEPTGVIGAARSAVSRDPKLSTVDNADRAEGQISTVLALAAAGAGRPGGQYGTAAGATAPAPSRVSSR